MTGATGEAAVYDNSGVLQSGAHVVKGSVVLSGSGEAEVDFTGAATFSSDTSFACTVTYESGNGGVEPLGVLYSNASDFPGLVAGHGFVIAGDDGAAVSYICVGT